MGRAAGDEEVDGNEGVAAVVDLGIADEGPARDRAGADRDHELGRGDGRQRVEQGRPHVLAHRAGDDDAIRVPRRGDELDAEAAELGADQGINALLARHEVAHVDASTDAILEDLDTPEDYERLRAWHRR